MDLYEQFGRGVAVFDEYPELMSMYVAAYARETNLPPSEICLITYEHPDGYTMSKLAPAEEVRGQFPG